MIIYRQNCKLDWLKVVLLASCVLPVPYRLEPLTKVYAIRPIIYLYANDVQLKFILSNRKLKLIGDVQFNIQST